MSYIVNSPLTARATTAAATINIDNTSFGTPWHLTHTASGTLGVGTSADSFLYSTSGSQENTVSSGTTVSFGSKTTGDTVNRTAILGNGSIAFSSGSTAADSYMRRNGANSVELSRDGAGTGAINLNIIGGTLFAAGLQQGSASITLPSNAITLTTASNQNISLNPNGTGVVAISSNITVPSTNIITYSSGGKITIQDAGNTNRGSILLGNNTQTSSANVSILDMGGSLSSTEGQNVKLKLYSDGVNDLGFGVSSMCLSGVVPSNSKFNWYRGTTKLADLDNNGLVMNSLPLVLSSGQSLSWGSNGKLISGSSNNFQFQDSAGGSTTTTLRAGNFDVAGGVLFSSPSSTQLNITNNAGSVDASNVHVGNFYCNNIRYQGDSSTAVTFSAGGISTFSSNVVLPASGTLSWSTRDILFQSITTSEIQAISGGGVDSSILATGTLKCNTLTQQNTSLNGANILIGGIGTGLRLQGLTSGNISIKAGDSTTSYTVKMPTSQGASGTFLGNDGSGGLTWTTSSYQYEITACTNTTVQSVFTAPSTTNGTLLGVSPLSAVVLTDITGAGGPTTARKKLASVASRSGSISNIQVMLTFTSSFTAPSGSGGCDVNMAIYYTASTASDATFSLLSSAVTTFTPLQSFSDGSVVTFSGSGGSFVAGGRFLYYFYLSGDNSTATLDGALSVTMTCT